MISLHVNSRFSQLRLATQIVGWSQTGEFDKFVDKVRLIEVSLRDGELRPLDLTGRLQQCHRMVETLHAAKELRREADFAGEQLGKSPLT